MNLKGGIMSADVTKVEISESAITKEHIKGETLLPDNVQTPKEIHNWILNLNNDRTSCHPKK